MGGDSEMTQLATIFIPVIGTGLLAILLVVIVNAMHDPKKVIERHVKRIQMEREQGRFQRR